LSLGVSVGKSGSVSAKRFPIKQIKIYKFYYVMVLPLIAWYIVFCYIPIYGITLAFKTYDFSKGILGSPWVGLANFKELFVDLGFRNALQNTLILSLGKLLFHFPVPLILAILLNEVAKSKLKKFYQTVFTFPHFISWIVLSGIIFNIFSQNGIYNQLIGLFGWESTSVLVDKQYFRPLIYVSHIWKEMGWDSIIYLAALAGINPEYYEAAHIDGANRFQRILYITWPCLRSTTAILLILSVGSIMNGVGFDQIFNLYSSPVYDVADTIDTYIYRSTFGVGMDFGYSTAIGFVKSGVNLILIWIANVTIKKLGEDGLF